MKMKYRKGQQRNSGCGFSSSRSSSSHQMLGGCRRSNAKMMRLSMLFLLAYYYSSSIQHSEAFSTNIMQIIPSSSLLLPVRQSSSFPRRCCAVSMLETSSSSSAAEAEADNESSSLLLLPQMYPEFSSTLDLLGLSTPTPIQAASAQQSLEGNNVLLIAPTGSGKTLAYLLPALTLALQNDSTIIIVAPTRELAIQLARDADMLLPNDNDKDMEHDLVQIAVRGLPPPLASSMKNSALLLVGTPAEVLVVLSSISREFVDRIGTVILDEVDVLLPNQPKSMRTSLDQKPGNTKKKKVNSSPQEERRKKEQKRKLQAQRRRDDTDSRSGEIISPTEQILIQVAGSNPQIVAGSATASRKTLDTLNRAWRKSRDGLSFSSEEEEETNKNTPVIAIRPKVVVVDDDDTDDSTSMTVLQNNNNIDENNELSSSSSGRSVSVPQEVSHRFVSLSKEEASSSTAALHAVARAVALLKPKTALLFLCGEFGKPNVVVQSKTPQPVTKGKTSQARRNSLRKFAGKKAKTTSAAAGGGTKTRPNLSISARSVCAKLEAYGIDAEPLHVAMGLEPNAPPVVVEKEEEEEEEDDHMDNQQKTSLLVTFEGSARGLHFDEVDAVFVVGRPASASSYLHLAGRVGRASPPKGDGGISGGDIVYNPGTVVSLCTKGQATELEKWTKQIGGTGGVQELLFVAQEEEEKDDTDAV